MNFKEVIKQEWEKEFPNIEYSYEESLTFAINSLLRNICVRVWNEALEQAADLALIAEHIPEEEQEEYDSAYIEKSGDYIRNEHYVTVSKNSILKYKINE